MLRQRRTCNELYIVLGGRGGVAHAGRRVVDLAEGDLLPDVARHIEDDHVVQFEADEPLELLCLDLAYVVDL